MLVWIGLEVKEVLRTGSTLEHSECSLRQRDFRLDADHAGKCAMILNPDMVEIDPIVRQQAESKPSPCAQVDRSGDRFLGAVNGDTTADRLLKVTVEMGDLVVLIELVDGD